jgi:hypothetical protein
VNGFVGIVQLGTTFFFEKSDKIFDENNFFSPIAADLVNIFGCSDTIDIESLKIDCLRFVVCLLIAPAFQGYDSSFLSFFCCSGHLQY